MTSRLRCDVERGWSQDDTGCTAEKISQSAIIIAFKWGFNQVWYCALVGSIPGVQFPSGGVWHWYNVPAMDAKNFKFNFRITSSTSFTPWRLLVEKITNNFSYSPKRSVFSIFVFKIMKIARSIILIFKIVNLWHVINFLYLNYRFINLPGDSFQDFFGILEFFQETSC